MKRIIIALLITSALFFSSCTENYRTKNLGGKMELHIPNNESLINITFKNDEIWVLTKDANSNIYHFREKSAYGIMEGEILLLQD